MLLVLLSAQPEAAACKFHPKITCRGHSEHAIFPNGLTSRPQLLEYSARVRDPAVIPPEDQNFDPPKALGYNLPGFRPSKSCKGLNFNDGHGDSAHIYWNHSARRFADWSL